MATDPLLVPPSRGAQIAGIGRDAFYGLLHAGEIAHIRVGRRFLVPVWAIEEWTRQAVKAVGG